MLKQLLTLSALGLIAISGAQASTLLPGGSVAASPLSFSGPELGFIGNTLSFGGSLANYRGNVYSDPTNVYCSGCLDFVYNLDNQSNADTFSSLSISGFAGFSTNVGYVAGQTDPTTILRSANGSVITFDFTLLPHHASDFLVIQTNANQFNTTALLSVTDASGLTQTASELGPVPEPSTLVLLGSGLVGLAGAAKRKLLA